MGCFELRSSFSSTAKVVHSPKPAAGTTAPKPAAGTHRALGSRPMRPTTATATGVGEGDGARSPEDVRAAFLQRKALRRAAGRAALRTAVSDDEKAARSAALLADRRARAAAARLALRTHPERGRPGLVITADAAGALKRRRQEVVSSLRTAHARMAAAPPPCTELERWRPIDQRPTTFSTFSIFQNQKK